MYIVASICKYNTETYKEDYCSVPDQMRFGSLWKERILVTPVSGNPILAFLEDKSYSAPSIVGVIIRCYLHSTVHSGQTV